jgi:hypothetical protein
LRGEGWERVKYKYYFETLNNCKSKAFGPEDSLPVEGEGKTTYTLTSLTQSILI